MKNGLMTSRCGNPAKGNEIEAYPKTAGEEIHKHLGKMKNRAEVAQDRTEWFNMAEAIILQWTPDGCQCWWL